MSDETMLHLRYDPKIEGENEVKQTWSDLLDLLKKKASEVWDATGEELGAALGDGIEAAGKTYDELGKSFKKTTTDAIKGSIAPLFKGEMDEVENIWGKAWTSMENTFDKQVNSLFDTLTGRVVEMPYNIFKQAFFDPEVLLKNYVTDPLKKMASDAGNWTVTALGGEVSGSVSSTALAISKIKGWLGIGGTPTDADMINAILAGGEDEMLPGITGGGQNMQGLLAGGFAGPTALMGYAAAPIVIGNLFGDQIGSGLNAVFGSNFGEAYTPETAQERISQDFEALDAAFASLTQSAQTMGDMFGGYLTPEVMNTATEIQNLADIAGYSQAELDAMAEGLGQGGAVFVSAAQLAQDLSYQIQDLVWNFHVVNEEGQLWQGGLNELNILLSDMVDGMGLGSEATEELRQSVFNLAEQLYSGDLTVEQITARLQEEFISALDETVQSGDAATESMLKIKEAITSIPTHWYTEYEVRTKQTGDIPGGMQVSQVAEGLYEGVISHGGGLLMHRGGFLEGLPRLHTGSMVSALAHDEVPVIARRGEYVVRAESVNAATLPLLQALNQTGRTQAQSAPPQVNLHVEVHGNILGGQENMEELARLLERKLRDLDQARYVA